MATSRSLGKGFQWGLSLKRFVGTLQLPGLQLSSCELFGDKGMGLFGETILAWPTQILGGEGLSPSYSWGQALNKKRIIAGN